MTIKATKRDRGQRLNPSDRKRRSQNPAESFSKDGRHGDAIAAGLMEKFES